MIPGRTPRTAVSTGSPPASREPKRRHYDVVIAGARCAGASTALLLARRGLRVLVVDPTRRGSDTLSTHALMTHALMRPGVLRLHRWGLPGPLRARGTPAIRRTTFHYGDEVVEVAIKARDGVDALFAPPAACSTGSSSRLPRRPEPRRSTGSRSSACCTPTGEGWWARGSPGVDSGSPG